MRYSTKTTLGYIAAMLIFLGVLLALRLAWTGIFPVSAHPKPIGGILDMRGIDLEKLSAIPLDGEWQLYPSELVSRQREQPPQDGWRTVRVPGSWKAAQAEAGTASPYGYGTYRLRILVDPLEHPVAFWVHGIQAASAIEINGQASGGSGTVAAKEEEYEPENVSYAVSYAAEGVSELEVLIRVANFDDPLAGGILRSIRFGSQHAVDHIRWYSIGFQLAIFVILLLHGLYACLLYLFNRKEKALFTTGLLMLSVGVAVLIGHDNLLLIWLPFNYTWTIKLRLIFLLWQNVFLLQLFRKFASAPPGHVWLRIYTGLLAAVTAILLAAPVSWAHVFFGSGAFLAAYGLTFVWFLYTVGTMIARKRDDPDLVCLLLTAAGIVSNLSWSIAESNADVTIVYYPVDLMVALIGSSAYWFKKYSRHSNANARLIDGLSFTSEPGKGSVFRFDLPLADAARRASATGPLAAESPGGGETNELPVEWAEPGAADGEAAAAAQLPPLPPLLQDRPIHILAVADNPVNLSVLTRILAAEPYAVTVAGSGQEALELLAARKWDLLIVDVMMPHMSGYELTQRVRETYAVSELPVLLLTARSQPADIYAGFLSGASDYLAKPVDALELRYRVRALTALKQSVDQRLRMEAAYLQAQIHPHFLFNTLNSIMALSEIDTEQMRRLGHAFASYLRIGFDFLNTGELVDLSRELELAQAYLYIEKARFGDRLAVVWEIDTTASLRLPPLTIQPLVENAVKHGLMSRRQGGTLTILVKRRERGTYIEVRDDGKGMEQEQADRLLGLTMNGGGIGLANTNRRLTQWYGRGLSIRSAPHEGTAVSFVIPDRQ